jgi:hypothetical protein
VAKIIASDICAMIFKLHGLTTRFAPAFALQLAKEMSGRCEVHRLQQPLELGIDELVQARRDVSTRVVQHA